MHLGASLLKMFQILCIDYPQLDLLEGVSKGIGNPVRSCCAALWKIHMWLFATFEKYKYYSM
jgi:hypothetical protein